MRKHNPVYNSITIQKPDGTHISQMVIKLEKILVAYFNLLSSTNMYGSNEPTKQTLKTKKAAKGKGEEKKKKGKKRRTKKEEEK